MEFRPGLENVVAAETTISFLDVENEEIVIRGYDLIELAETKSYVEVAFLLLEGKLPSEQERARFENELLAKRELPDVLYDVFSKLPKTTHPMDALRTGISILAGFDPLIDARSEQANKTKSINLLGQMPSILASSYHLLNQQEVIPPDENLSYSANFLYMITGKKPTELETKIFDRSLIAYIEHEMPNSTFAARVISSTHADLYGALAGAVSSLKGHLHGGANEAVMYLIEEAGTKENFERLIKQKLANKERIMGFGHRVYMKKMDPRALLMKKALQQLSEQRGDFRLLEICEAGETIMREEKGLYPNLDYYAAPVYYMLGIPIDLYTPIFFSARTAGLCAHVIEQHNNNRLFRPRVKYTGKRSLKVQQ
ncbi:citrate synthase [Aeribacillus composti]|uniref:citrate synthase n=1 Tax=Aeribacillus composti TaxID=1868734 RepID=UPI002E247437|nr:citrate synthase [Aeribacillus composti]